MCVNFPGAIFPLYLFFCSFCYYTPGSLLFKDKVCWIIQCLHENILYRPGYDGSTHSLRIQEIVVRRSGEAKGISLLLKPHVPPVWKPIFFSPWSASETTLSYHNNRHSRRTEENVLTNLWCYKLLAKVTVKMELRRKRRTQPNTGNPFLKMQAACTVMVALVAETFWRMTWNQTIKFQGTTCILGGGGLHETCGGTRRE